MAHLKTNKTRTVFLIWPM